MRARSRTVRFEPPSMGARATSLEGERSARSTLSRAAWRAAPTALTAALAAAGATRALPVPEGMTAALMGLVVAGQAVGVGLSAALDRPGPRPFWQVALYTTLVLLPILALQAAASRVPFVAVARGSAGPLLWLTVAATVAMVGLWFFACYQSDRQPADSALLFLPAALIVPATLGAPGSLDEISTLSMLGEAFGLAAVVIFFGLLSPPSWRQVAGGVALAAQFAVLWLMGRRPVIGDDAGAVVPLSAAWLLALTALLIVLAPLGALISRRFFQTVEEEAGTPPTGGRRQDDY